MRRERLNDGEEDKSSRCLFCKKNNSLAAAASGASGPETEGVATPAPDLDGAVEVAVEVAGSVTARAVARENEM